MPDLRDKVTEILFVWFQDGSSHCSEISGFGSNWGFNFRLSPPKFKLQTIFMMKRLSLRMGFRFCEILSFCVTQHFHDGRDSCHVG